MEEIRNRVGEIYKMKRGDILTIVEYFSARNCTVQFEDGTKLKNIQFSAINVGSVVNKTSPSVFGVGYMGIGFHTSKTNPLGYSKWVGMLERCYSKKYQEKHTTYEDCVVDLQWHNFQVFIEWFENNDINSFELDKDILVKGNKIYSPDTCCFIPQEINKLFTKTNNKRGEHPIGVHKKGNRFYSQILIKGKKKYLGYFDTPKEAFQAYKIAKEHYIKEVAAKWRGQLTKQVYEALINYKVEITD